MNPRDALDADFAAWLDNETRVPVPTAARERVLAAIASRQPRPAHVARIGSHLVVEPSPTAAPFGRRIGLPGLGARSAIVLVLVSLALIGVAAFIGSRQVPHPPELRGLVYELGGAIYLADHDGGKPVRVAPGGLASGAIWARDGRHFLFHEDGAHVSDADGRVVGSFDNAPGFNGFPTWSPDSTRLQAWTHGFTRISIYGIDGVLQTALPLPDGYVRQREKLGVWAPDGRSVYVRIARGSGTGAGPGEAWELPIDGSAPTQIADDDPLASVDLSVSPDGLRVAYSRAWSLFVANADGTNPEGVRTGRSAFNPVWSPTGTHIAYLDHGPNSGYGIRVVDLQSGLDRELIPGYDHDGWPPLSWSPTGDRVLVLQLGGAGVGGLWTVATDGGDTTMLVEGATFGEWQPAPPAPAAPSETPAATVAPTARPVPVQPLPTGRCSVIVKQVHRFADMARPELATVLDAPASGAPYRVAMEAHPTGGFAAVVSVLGPYWGPIIDVVVIGPDGTREAYTIEHRAPTTRSMSEAFGQVGTHVIEVSSVATDCAATLVFEVTGPA